MSGVFPLPLLTWAVLSKIPDFVLVGGTMLGGVAWIINRRMTLEEERIAEAERRRIAGEEEPGALKRFLDRFKKG